MLTTLPTAMRSWGMIFWASEEAGMARRAQAASAGAKARQAVREAARTRLRPGVVLFVIFFHMQGIFFIIVAFFIDRS